MLGDTEVAGSPLFFLLFFVVFFYSLTFYLPFFVSFYVLILFSLSFCLVFLLSVFFSSALHGLWCLVRLCVAGQDVRPICRNAAARMAAASVCVGFFFVACFLSPFPPGQGVGG